MNLMPIRAALAPAEMAIRKNAPTILTVSGIAAMTAGAVTAAVKGYSYKEKVVDKYVETRNLIDQTRVDSDAGKLVEPYTEQEEKRDKVLSVAQLGVRTVVHFTPAIALTVGGAALVWGGHGVAMRRVAALTAAYSTLQESYDKLREKTDDQPILDGSETHEVEASDGTKKEVPGLASPYERYFGPENPNWNREKMITEAFLAANQNYFNDLLQARGFVFLNEVYEALGIPQTSAGQVVGWIKGNKDNYISFIPSRHEDIYDDEGNMYAAWILDFNVDGVVYDKIGD